MLWVVKYVDVNGKEHEDDFESHGLGVDDAMNEWMQEHPEFEVLSIEEA